ncbi:cytochrome P450 monooxygenase-like protein [Saccharata proteae CBS 121410]|uniref:Cytochrome P450 monooxygenase-like protein n=1 Tax=Saccharata proteae CBS 121410 TaxID=1314787 RepID=A0A9P4HM64_9PEZI|nr:cytochrome P450 monooxygenase-like protein [Saccharata proteae CBS 121410]
MESLPKVYDTRAAATLGGAVLFAWVSYLAYGFFYNLYLHPMVRFPGPRAAAATRLWKAWIECVQEKSFCHELEKLHEQYGPVMRVGPNELHFADPQAYQDIYNNKNRWDKEERLYHSFNEDRSSFGFLTYREAKERKDVLNRSFSPKAIEQCEELIINALCAVFASTTQPQDLFYAFRCITMEIISYLCFGESTSAIQAPSFRAPILLSLDATIVATLSFKHIPLYKSMILGCPPALSRVLSPEAKGLVDMQQMLRRRIGALAANPEEGLNHLPHGSTIFHRLMDRAAHKTGTLPSSGSLYEEAQALLFAGSDTVGHTLMVGTFHLLKRPDACKKLKRELEDAWPLLDSGTPSAKELEKLVYLDAVIKEALRLSLGVVSGLPRIVPAGGAKIAGTAVPGGTIVSSGSTFVHYNATIFPEPREFRPERWLEDSDLDYWLVSFSKGPRMCLGINLAWTELRLAFAHFFRRFDLELDDASPRELVYRDCFLPHYLGEHVHARLKPVMA